MGKGDKKTKRGKIIMGSYGVRRPRKSGSQYQPENEKATVKVKKTAAKEEKEPKTPVAKKTTPKKPATKKPAAKKEVASKPTAQKDAPASKKADDTTAKS